MNQTKHQEICLSGRKLLELVYEAFNVYAKFEYPQVSGCFLNIHSQGGVWKNKDYTYFLNCIEKRKFEAWLSPTETYDVIEHINDEAWDVITKTRTKDIWQIKTNFIPIILKALCEKSFLNEGHYIIYNG